MSLATATDAGARLGAAAALMNVPLTPEDAARLLALLKELTHWNEHYNLTAITDPEAMLTEHLLDSLSVHGDLAGERIADAGTGAGFPGLPLAVVNPQRQFTLIDSSGKKIRFVAHAVRTLGLANVTPLQARLPTLRPPQPYDTVLARALAPLPKLLPLIAPLVGPATRVLALKGRRPQAELEALPAPWREGASRTLTVPGLDAARCVIVLERP